MSPRQQPPRHFSEREEIPHPRVNEHEVTVNRADRGDIRVVFSLSGQPGAFALMPGTARLFADAITIAAQVIDGITVTSLVDDEISNLYDEIMLRHPAERSIAEEAFIEYVGERLVAEVTDEYGDDVFINDEGVIPRCDICGKPQSTVGDDWNGETGSHYSCEDPQYSEEAGT